MELQKKKKKKKKKKNEIILHEVNVRREEPTDHIDTSPAPPQTSWEHLKAYVNRSLNSSPDDPFWAPFRWYNVFIGILSAMVLEASMLLSDHVTLSKGVVLIWMYNPCSTLLLCTQKRETWPYIITAIVAVAIGGIITDNARINDLVAASVLFVPDLAAITLSVLLLRPLILDSIVVVRSATFIRYLVYYVLVVTPMFTLINVAIIVLIPTNPINWVGGRQLLVVWLLGDFFSNYFTVYTILVFRYTIVSVSVR